MSFVPSEEEAQEAAIVVAGQAYAYGVEFELAAQSQTFSLLCKCVFCLALETEHISKFV